MFRPSPHWPADRPRCDRPASARRAALPSWPAGPELADCAGGRLGQGRSRRW